MTELEVSGERFGVARRAARSAPVLGLASLALASAAPRASLGSALVAKLALTGAVALRPLRLQRLLWMLDFISCELAHKRGGPQRHFVASVERSETRATALGRATSEARSEAGAAERARAPSQRGG